MEISSLRAAWIGLFGEMLNKTQPDCFGTLTLRDIIGWDGQVFTPGHQASGRYIDEFLHNLDSATLVVEEFGKKNGRRHFHLISKSSAKLEDKFEKWKETKGFIKIERMQSSLACMGYISKYMTKDYDSTTARFWLGGGADEQGMFELDEQRLFQ